MRMKKGKLEESIIIRKMMMLRMKIKMRKPEIIIKKWMKQK